MLFRRRPKHPPLTEISTSAERPQFFQIEFDMMLKGSIYKRRKKTVRQFGVTVNGATRLVTSGDLVDRDTYKALLAAGAVRPAMTETSDAARGESAGKVPATGKPPANGTS